MSDELDPGALPTDAVLVRTLREADLPRIITIDKKSVGRPREEYFRSKVKAASDAKMTTSLVAEQGGLVVGFVLAKLYYGEFGRTEPVAVMEAIGVDPEFRHKHVGQALMRQLEMNLRALNVERIETDVEWNQFDLLSFLAHRGFTPAPRVCLSLKLS
ncbi:MAG: GNAT family N-acetyltransferase [Myxococcaceae bacterium]|nr:GNAT family N-acetyltransferase [Myxococcaceae bacterium]